MNPPRSEMHQTGLLAFSSLAPALRAALLNSPPNTRARLKQVPITPPATQISIPLARQVESVNAALSDFPSADSRSFCAPAHEHKATPKSITITPAMRVW